MARARKKSHAGRWWLLALALLIVAGVSFFFLHDGSWAHFRTDLFSRHATAAACGDPLPKFSSGALAASRSAQFATIEQLASSSPSGSAPVYRIQARLLSLAQEGSQIHLRLGSLVNSHLTLDAFLPSPTCGATQEDTALYEELREIVTLRFGPLQPHLVPPSHPASVIAIGALVRSGRGLQLRPLLDLHVQ